MQIFTNLFSDIFKSTEGDDKSGDFNWNLTLYNSSLVVIITLYYITQYF